MSRNNRQDPIYSSTAFIFLFNPPKHAWLPVNDSLRVTSFRSDTISTIECNVFHYVAANGAREQETFHGQRTPYTMSHPPTAVTAIKA
jgi:hypothetical protein